MRWTACLAVALAVAAVAPVNAAPAPADYAPYVVGPLIDGVRLMTTPPDYPGFATSNIVLIEQADGVVVIDTGVTRADGERVVRYVRSWTKKPVKAVVFTHWHNDHPQGASAIVAAWPKARVIATAATRVGIDGPMRSLGLEYGPSPKAEAATTKQITEAIAGYEKMAAAPTADAGLKQRVARAVAAYRARLPDLKGTRAVAPTEILGEKIVIDDPDRPVELLFLGRANTDGDAIAWLPKQRLVATGDVVVSPVPFGFFSYPRDWIETLGKIKALGFELLVPGHGLPQSDSGYIDRLIATIADIRAQVGALAAQGLSLEDIRKKVDFSAQTAIFGPSPRRKLGFENLWLRPMIDNAWREATGKPIIQGGEGEKP